MCFLKRKKLQDTDTHFRFGHRYIEKNNKMCYAVTKHKKTRVTVFMSRSISRQVAPKVKDTT